MTSRTFRHRCRRECRLRILRIDHPVLDGIKPRGCLLVAHADAVHRHRSGHGQSSATPARQVIRTRTERRRCSPGQLRSMKGGMTDQMEVSVGLPVVSTHFDDEVVVSELSAEISSTKEQGYFVADTRLVSGYRLELCGDRPILLNGAAARPHSARFELTNPTVVGSNGNDTTFKKSW